jgi:hypothetical protein
MLTLIHSRGLTFTEGRLWDYIVYGSYLPILSRISFSLSFSFSFILSYSFNFNFYVPSFLGNPLNESVACGCVSAGASSLELQVCQACLGSSRWLETIRIIGHFH